MALKEKVYTEFRGMNRRTDRLNSPPDFIYDQLNGYILKDFKGSNLGVPIQRQGSEKFNSVQLGAGYGATKIVKMVYEAKWDGGGTDIIIRAGTAFGKFDGINTFDTLITGRANNSRGQAAMFLNELILADGGITQKVTSAYATSNLSADANMPQDATAVWIHRDKVWLNSQASPMIASFSKTNDANSATAWTGSTDAGKIDLRTVLPDGDTILGFRTYGGKDSGLIAIICRKYTVIYEAGSNVYDFQFLQYFPTTCLSINAAQYVGKDVVYPSKDSLTSIISSANNEEVTTKSLSHFLGGFWGQLMSTIGDTELIVGQYYKKLSHYYMTIPLTNNFQVYVWSVDVGNFVGRFVYPFNIHSMTERINGDLLAGGEDGYVYKLDTGTDDDGTAISWKLSMPALYFGKPQNYKKPQEIEALVQASTTLDLSIDYWYGLTVSASDKITKTITITASSSLWDVALWDVASWDTEGNAIIRTGDILGRGRLLFLEFRHNTSGSRIKLPWFLIRYALEGRN